MPTDLWHFALALYQQTGVEDACLQLQDQGADICLLLCGAWLERRQIGCQTERVTALRNLAEPWQEQVVLPLRQLRQHWREAAQDDKALAKLREQVKQLELAAEREQLQRLAACTQSWPGTAPNATPNWLEHLAPAACERAALHSLRSAALQLRV